MKFYGDTGDANSGTGGKHVVSISNGQDFSAPAASSAPSAPDNTGAGKGSIDLGDPVGSVQKTAGAFGDFLGGLGQIGIPGGPNIGGVVGGVGGAIGGAVGGVAGAIGSIPLPYLGNDPTKTNAHLGDVPGLVAGAVGTVASAPEQFLETQAAKGRLEIASHHRTATSGPQTNEFAQSLAGQVEPNANIPPDIQARLDAGESVDSLAAEMAQRGEGFSNDKRFNTVASTILDPLNLLSFGAGKVAGLAKNADRALQAGEQLGVGERFMGTAYGAASRGLSAGGQALIDHTLGPATSGVFHALGTASYNAVKNGVSHIAPEYGSAFVDAFARGAAQMPRAVIGRYLADEATSAIKRAIGRAGTLGRDTAAAGRAALEAQPQDIGGTIESRLSAIRTVNNDQIERRTEELLSRVTPDFAGHTDAARFAESRDKLAAITGMSPEDAASALGGKANIKTAQTIHLAFYGKAGDDLARAKQAAIGLAKNIDPERLTLVSDDTLTAERAAAILSGKTDIISAVDQYSILRNRFGNTAFEHGKVTDFIKKLANEDALTHTVDAAVTGKNALPRELGDWRAAYGKFGYDIGFAPRDGWKTVIDHETGQVLYADPFVHFTSEADPLTQRNPLGRFADSLFRGSAQTQIIADSRARMVAIGRKAGISANESRAVHNRILQEAADVATSPRGLALGAVNPYPRIFQDVLGPERYAEFIKTVDPDFAVMKAFQGNLGRVGLTQAFTGAVKTATAGHGNIVAGIAEGIYPALRFRFSPLFQAQEIVESPFFNLLRGVRSRIVTKDVQDVYNELSDLPDFKYLAEAGYTLNIAGAAEVGRTITAKNNLMGKALARFGNVKAFKEQRRVAQVMFEHGPEFEDAVNKINPKLWSTMVDAYGTTDPREIADAFITERSALASGEMDKAMATFDGTRAAFIQGCYDNGLIAEGQAANIAEGVARGANGAGGAMKLTAEELARLGGTSTPALTHDMETVWQAFRESFRQTSEQAFKTHYFNPTRGFLERTINHPYLGIYPASYMWGKVLPEFMRFLVKRPFGLNAPLVGLVAYQRVQQTVIAALAQDPALQKWVNDSDKKGVLYIVDQMLPASPANIPANAPAWARHLSQDLAGHKKIDPQAFATREATDTFSNAAGPLKSFNAATGVAGDIGDIYARLSHAATQLDAQFPHG